MMITLPAATDLRRFIDSRGISVQQFCEEHALDRIQVLRALNGNMKRVSVEFAADVERATDGAVRWDRWLPPARVRAELRRQRSQISRESARKRRASRAEVAP